MILSSDELLTAIRASGKAIMIMEASPGELYRRRHSLDAFNALNEILWGCFYRDQVKYAEQSAFKTAEEAIDAYRTFIGEVLKEYDLDLDQGMAK